MPFFLAYIVGSCFLVLTSKAIHFPHMSQYVSENRHSENETCGFGVD